MSRRRSRRNEERNRAIFLWLFKAVVVVGALGFIAYYSYEVGKRVDKAETSSLEEKLSEATERVRVLQDQAETNTATLAETRKQSDELKALYDQVRPDSELSSLIALLRGKLASGMTPNRLAFVIKSAQNPRNCDDAVSRRFLVRTARYKGADTSTMLRFSELVTLSAEGAGANGGREQWFDPDLPIKLHISAVGLRDDEIAGPLPLEYAVATRGSEFHFVVSKGASRGFVDVTSQRCEFH